MSDKKLAEKNGSTLDTLSDVDTFLNTVKSTPPSAVTQGRGRLIFSLDATASRQGTWNRAMSLQTDMFSNTHGIGDLDVQLVYYRGYDECRASPWLRSADKVAGMMKKVSCLAGTTQIDRVLKHALAEARAMPVQALVFIGDCVEEDLDQLGSLCGKCKIMGMPLFIFQEGRNAQAARAFRQMAELSGGAHCQFDESSASALGDLLNAVAAFAAGGKSQLLKLEQRGSRQAKALLQQLDN